MAQDFWAKVDTSGGPDACWLWAGSRNRGGYGVHRPHRARRYRAAPFVLAGLWVVIVLLAAVAA